MVTVCWYKARLSDNSAGTANECQMQSYAGMQGFLMRLSVCTMLCVLNKPNDESIKSEHIRDCHCIVTLSCLP